MTPWPERPLAVPPLPWTADHPGRPWPVDDPGASRRMVVEQVTRGDVTATRWEITEHPAVTHYPERRVAAPAREVEVRSPWPLVVAGAAILAVVGVGVWLSVLAAEAVVSVVADNWPAILGVLALLGLLAVTFGGGSCKGLHCGGCRRH